MRGPTIKTLPRGTARLLSYYLKYKNNPADSIYKDYCRTQVVLLEGLQRTYLSLLVTLRDLQDTVYTFRRYSDAYRQCRRYYQHLDPNLAPLQKLSPEVQARINKEELEERINTEDTDPVYQDKLNVRRTPYNPNALRNRDIDINADWSSFISKYATLFPNIYYYLQRKYQKEEIAANPTELRIDSQSIG